jgi:hypothetical protein
MPACLTRRSDRFPVLVRGDRTQKNLAELLELGSTDAIDLGEGIKVMWAALSHVDQCAIGEHHIGRHPALLRQTQPQGFEHSQQRSIQTFHACGQLPGDPAARCTAAHFDAILERDVATAKRMALLRDGKATMAARIWCQKPARDELADQRQPEILFVRQSGPEAGEPC